MPKLSDAEIEHALSDLENWNRRGDEIVRDFRFRDFVGAMGFIAQVGLLAERADHHPNLSNVYNRVVITLTSHDEGGITERDIKLATEINERAG